MYASSKIAAKMATAILFALDTMIKSFKSPDLFQISEVNYFNQCLVQV